MSAFSSSTGTVAVLDAPEPYDVVTPIRESIVRIFTPVIRPTIRNSTILSPSVEVLNIPFNVRRSDDLVFLESPNWPSLMAYGEDYQEAVREAVKLIQFAIDIFVLVPEEELAEDGRELRRYLIDRVFPTSPAGYAP